MRLRLLISHVWNVPHHNHCPVHAWRSQKFAQSSLYACEQDKSAFNAYYFCKEALGVVPLWDFSLQMKCKSGCGVCNSIPCVTLMATIHKCLEHCFCKHLFGLQPKSPTCVCQGIKYGSIRQNAASANSHFSSHLRQKDQLLKVQELSFISLEVLTRHACGSQYLHAIYAACNLPNITLTECCTLLQLQQQHICSLPASGCQAQPANSRQLQTQKMFD